MPPSRLFTIGYEGRTPEEYLGLLLGAGVTLLCDVRANPFSRKRGFSKRALAEACAAAGLRYEHLPELGIAKEQRRSVLTRADRDALFATYARESLPKQGAALDQLRAWLAAGERVALTCYERDPTACHRSHVAAALGGGGEAL
ncbi:MAG: DUF488 domain-containing protein [Polyangiaceae bacterium]|nr:DUF488 domain-containing protein [Polyangiaceae bacterium]